ncbi:MAG: iron-containing alcohol dehydrogenase [Pirellulales bacterium]|nr:iron-containing alcohol dehydrogenase [Pirellulales bacterium]
MHIEGRTNVTSQRFGSGSIDGLGRELGRFVVATMELPWNLVRERLGALPEAVVCVESLESDVVERQLAAMPPCDTVLAVGGGQAVDLGKYLAWRRGCRLVTVPTVISVDAFVTPKAALRRNHIVEYVGDSSPDPLVIDYDLLRTAPAELNIAGAGDVLSCHTATFDWELAQRAGRSTYPFSAADVAAGRRLVQDMDDQADEIRRVTDAGLQAIVDAYLRINTICLPADHYRVEEGSEHFVFYELEQRLGRGFIHGHIVGLGIYLMSRLQENDHERIVDLMHRLDLRFQPADMEIPRAALAESLLNVRAFTERHHHWYSVIQEREITPAWIEDALAGLRFTC